MNNFSTTETTAMIPGPAGIIEARIIAPLTEVKTVSIVCHPHPVYGGTMNNKVVTTVARTLKNLGSAVVRFNFRGVGKSEGQYAQGSGEVEDLLAVLKWVKQIYPQCSIWLAGFSFGAYVAAKVAINQSIEKLILIAPPVNHFDFTQLLNFSNPVWIVQGEQDKTVPATEVYAWIKNLAKTPHIIRLATADHFFHGHLGELQSELEKELKNC